MIEVQRGLLRIQALDTETGKVDAFLADCPRQRKEVDEKVVRAGRGVELARRVLAGHQEEEDRIEEELRELAGRVADLEDKQMHVTSKQGQAVLREKLGEASEARSKLETEALELLEVIETSLAEVARAEERERAVAAGADEERAVISAREAEQRTQRAVLIEDRAKACAALDPKALKQYEAVRSMRTPAVLVLRAKSCPKCGYSIPKQLLMDVQRGESLHPCQNCRRLLLCERVLEPLG